MNEVLKSLSLGSTIGIIGGGQLGQMLSNAARKIGYQTHIFANNINEPAIRYCDKYTIAEFNNFFALKKFFQQCDIITFEFENIPVKKIEKANTKTPILPNLSSLSISQDRLHEKDFLNKNNLKTTKFIPINSANDITAAFNYIGSSGILKTRKFGYDGKGQFNVSSINEINKAWESLNKVPSILESKVNFISELSVIIARNQSGETKEFDVIRNVHKKGILSNSYIPAEIEKKLEKKCIRIAKSIVEKLNYFGVLTVEMFLTKNNTILINEIAPRVHNSGHWTIDSCITSQFEQHIRAICNLPLGSSKRHSDALMTNIIGDEIKNIERIFNQPNTKIYLYGKKISSSGRKMGHYTKIIPKIDKLV